MSNYQSLNIKQAIESYGLSALIGRQVAVGVAFDDTETDVEVGVIVDPASYFEPFDPSDYDPESLYVRIEMEEADLIHKITGNEKFLLLDDIGESMATEINQLKLKAADRDKLQDELIVMMNQRDSALAQLAAIQAKAAESGTWLRDSNVNGGKRQSEVK